jgi:hypothetical protein
MPQTLVNTVYFGRLRFFTHFFDWFFINSKHLVASSIVVDVKRREYRLHSDGCQRYLPCLLMYPFLYLG